MSILARIDTETAIVPDIKHNSLPENKNSRNIYITGDNLDGLKHLLRSYQGKVDVIYIDPPYNTGSDEFAYNDDFDFTSKELSQQLEIGMEEAERILELTKRGASSHSAWLMFMLPRLLLAQNILSEKGLIFISIKDNEQAELKLLCDEIFGERNFLSLLCVKMSHLSGVKMTHKEKRISNIKEFVYVYAKDMDMIHLNPIHVPGKWEDVLGRYTGYIENFDQDIKANGKE